MPNSCVKRIFASFLAYRDRYRGRKWLPERRDAQTKSTTNSDETIRRGDEKTSRRTAAFKERSPLQLIAWTFSFLLSSNGKETRLDLQLRFFRVSRRIVLRNWFVCKWFIADLLAISDLEAIRSNGIGFIADYLRWNRFLRPNWSFES